MDTNITNALVEYNKIMIKGKMGDSVQFFVQSPFAYVSVNVVVIGGILNLRVPIIQDDHNFSTGYQVKLIHRSY